MILVDTSIWIDHFNKGGVAGLDDLLARERIVMHPFVFGEIAMGSLQDRRNRLALLSGLHSVEHATHEEVMVLVESRPLYNTGVGYIDAHLLASATAARQSEPIRIWTKDGKFLAQADALDVAYMP